MESYAEATVSPQENDGDEDNYLGEEYYLYDPEIDEAIERAYEDTATEEAKRIKGHLIRAFISIEINGAGSLAVSNTVSAAPVPGLYIHGFGPIGLPLSERDAQSLEALSSPEGQDSSSMLQWATSEFVLYNPEWHDFVIGLIPEITRGLGVAENELTIKAQLNKMLLQGENVSFDKQQNSGVSQGTFATLMIALPSKHEGGEIDIGSTPNSLYHSTSLSSAFAYSWVAWYAELNYAGRPLIEGHRLVLQYDLVYTPQAPIPSAVTVLEQQRQLSHIFDYWKRQVRHEDDLPLFISEHPDKLVYEFDYKYSDSTLRLASLKGHDRVKAMSVRNLGGPRGFKLLLANVEKIVDGVVESSRTDLNYGEFHTIDLVNEAHLRLTHVVDEYGKSIGGNLELEEADLIRPIGQDLNPDHEDYDHHYGTCTHVWNRSAMIMIPGERYVDYLFDAACKKSINFSKWLDELLFEYQKRNNRLNRMNLYKFCAKLLVEVGKYQSQPIYSKLYSFRPEEIAQFLELVLKVAAHLKSPDFIWRVADLITGELPLAAYPIFGSVLRQMKVVNCKSGLFSAVKTKFMSMQRRHQAIGLMRSEIQKAEPVDEEDLECFDEVSRKLMKLDFKIAPPCPEDGDLVVSLACEMEERFVFSSILPEVKEHIEDIPFIVRFLNGLAQASEDGKISRNVAKSLFKDVITNFASMCTFSDVVSVCKRQKLPGDSFLSTKVTCSIAPKDLARLVDKCFSLEVFDGKQAMLITLQDDAEKLDKNFFTALVIPFLSCLASTLERRSVPLTAPSRYNIFYSKMIYLFVRQGLGPMPKAPNHWLRGRVRHTCPECAELNRFLRDTNKETEYLQVSHRQQGHLREQLRSMSDTVTYKTLYEGSGSILRVTKIDPKHSKEMERWLADKAHVERNIDSLGEDVLQDVFGVSSADRVLLLSEMASLLDLVPMMAPLPTAAHGFNPSMALGPIRPQYRAPLVTLP